jgi:elongation factor P
MEMNDLKKLGTVIKINNNPHVVIESQHSKTARSKACVRTKLKNLITNATLEKTFNASDKIESADIERTKASFLYSDNNEAFFMDSNTYEQLALPINIVSEQINFLKEGQEVSVMLYENRPISIILPTKIELKITETEPATRGDTAQGSVTKKAKLETGAVINVPIFVQQDEMVRVNTEAGEYVERV